jgi:very-short-patch-repair endonuclease
MSVTQSVRRRGLAATHELHSDGYGRAAIATAVSAGDIIRVRQGWYAPRDLNPLLLQASRVGGALTCVSALRLHGCWTFPDADLHVRVSPNASRLRTQHNKRVRLADHPAGVRVHWRDGSERLLLPPLECLADALACVDHETALVLADSVRRVHPEGWDEFIRSIPQVHHDVLVRADGVCESGTETLFYDRLGRRLRMRRQVTIVGVGRVDFVLGNLIIEIDGAQYHLDPERFESDRRRDAIASALGYRVLRFSYWQVVERWAEVEAAVWAAVSRGDHH